VDSDSAEPESAEPTQLEEPAARHIAPEEDVVAADPAPDPEPEIEPAPEPVVEPIEVRGVAAHASTTLTDGVYDEIRRLRSKVADGR
jgi:hypothetical protein